MFKKGKKNRKVKEVVRLNDYNTFECFLIYKHLEIHGLLKKELKYESKNIIFDK